MKLNEKQLSDIDAQVKRLIKTDSYYGKMYRELGITKVENEDDFRKIPFSSKADLRNAYPLGIPLLRNGWNYKQGPLADYSGLWFVDCRNWIPGRL